MSLKNILGTDLVKDSRTDINDNFTFLDNKIDAIESEPAGVDGQIQFNDDGVLGGVPNIVMPDQSQVISNGEFTGSVSPWVIDSGWSWSEGYVETTTSGYFEQTFTELDENFEYEIEFDLEITGGSVAVQLRHPSGLAGLGAYETTGTHRIFRITERDDFNQIRFTYTGTDSARITRVSIKKSENAIVKSKLIVNELDTVYLKSGSTQGSGDFSERYVAPWGLTEQVKEDDDFFYYNRRPSYHDSSLQKLGESAEMYEYKDPWFYELAHFGDATRSGFYIAGNQPGVLGVRNGGPTNIYGRLDFSNITSTNKTFTFPNAQGTVGTVITKETTGDPAATIEGLFAINTFDNTFKVYADGGWRTLTTW